jgi:hypothetical protein
MTTDQTKTLARALADCDPALVAASNDLYCTLATITTLVREYAKSGMLPEIAVQYLMVDYAESVIEKATAKGQS